MTVKTLESVQSKTVQKDNFAIKSSSSFSLMFLSKSIVLSARCTMASFDDFPFQNVCTAFESDIFVNMSSN